MHSHRNPRFRPNLVTVAVACCFALGPQGRLLANPVGPVVAHGSASFAASGGVLSVTNAPGTIINWQRFSIGAGETTRFIQSSAASAVLNRVTGGDPSAILGALQSNGRVFLVNPNGIVFGAGSRVDVAGLVASTLALSNEDFLGGRMRFGDGQGAAGLVANQGSLTAARGGPVYLIGAGVDNQGTITAPGGDIVLAAGQVVRVADAVDGRLRVEITAPAGKALNLSEVVGGPAGAYAGLVRNAGTVRADAAVIEEGGRIVLKATHGVAAAASSALSANGASGGSVTVATLSGDVRVQGEVSAAGAGGRGGTVVVAGERTGMLGGARVDASGTSGGGRVLIGGDLRGKAIADGEGTLAASQRTWVAPDAVISADATHSGDGGTVIVWGQDLTRFHGAVSARGGPEGGDGGFAEISGRQSLDFSGRVDVGAANGRGGTLLFDPLNIILSTGTQANRTGFAPPGDQTEAWNDDAGLASVFRVGAGGSFAGVAAGSTIVLEATNDITVANAFNIGASTGQANVSLELRAGNNVNVNAAVTATGTGTLALKADHDFSVSGGPASNGAGNVSLAAALATAGGAVHVSGVNVSSTGAGSITTTGAANAAGGTVNVSASGTVSLAGAITANGGAGTAGAGGRAAGDVSVTGAGAVTTGAITASGGNGSAGAGAAGGNGGTIAVTGAGAIGTQAITANGGAGGGTIGAGGGAGTITVTNNSATTGTLVTGSLTARTGASTGAAPSGAAGSVTITQNAAGALLQTGAINTSGNANGAGGTVSLTAAGALGFSGGATISSAGGAAASGTAGRDGGDVSLTGLTVTTGGTITASGSAGNGTNQAGGDAGDVTIVAGGTISTTGGTITASGGNAGAGGASGAGGRAGLITITNTSLAAGNIATGALTARSGNAVGAGAAAAPGGVTVMNSNATAGATLTTLAIDVRGGAKGAGGAVVLESAGDVGVTGAITASGGGAAAGGSHGGAAAGTVAISGVNRAVSGGITASGGAAAGTNQAGGAAGTVTSTGSGTLTTAAIATQTGAATGTGTGGGAGSITLSGAGVTTGALTASGGANGNGGTIAVTSTMSDIANNGAVTVSGGAANAGSAGTNAGTITIRSAGAYGGSGLTLSASGGSANGATLNLAGGQGGRIDIESVAGTTVGAVTASGGAGSTTGGAGGSAGAIEIANSGSGNISTGALAARTGNAQGTGTGGAVAATAIAAGNLAAGGSLTVASFTTTGGTNGAGGNVTLSSLGATNVTGNSATSGGTAGAGTAGRNAGTISITGGTVSTANLNATGSAGSGANVAGGAGGTVSVTSATGTIAVRQVVSSGGSAGGTGTANGGAAGTITFDAATGITLKGTALTARGGNRAGGGGTPGGGGTIRLADPVTLGASVTLTATGGNAGVGTSGDIVLEAAVDGTAAGAQSLTLTTLRGDVSLNGAVGATTPLAALTVSANDISIATVGTSGAAGVSGNLAVTAATAGADTGSTMLGGVVNTGGAQTYNGAGLPILLGGELTTANGNVTLQGPVTLATDAAISAGTATVTFGSTVAAGARNLAVRANEINLAGAVTGGAGLSLAPGSTAASMTLGAGADTSTAVLDLTAADLGFIQPGFASIMLGRGDSSGNVTVNNMVLRNPTTVQTGSGTIAGAGNITGDVAGRDLNLSAGMINLTGALGTAGTRLGRIDASATGHVGLGAVQANDVLTAVAGGNLTLNGALASTVGGDAVVLVAGGNFSNNAGAGAISTPSGRWLVYSNDPATDNRGGLAYGFKQYDATYGVTPVAGAGNGFLYRSAPSLAVGLTGPVAKVYDATNAAALSPGDFSVTGAIDGDFIALDLPVAGTYDTRHAGTNKSVTATGIALTGATNGAAPVYGYRLASDSAIGNVGTITPRPITVASGTGQGKVYGADDPASAKAAYSLTGGTLAGGDALAGEMGRVAGETAGSYAFTAGSVTVSDGNAGGNYSITFDGTTNRFAVSPAPLGASLVGAAKVYGTSDPAPGTIGVVLGGVVNRVVTDIDGNTTPIDDTGSLAVSLASLVRASGENVGAHSITGGTFTALTGPAAANYASPVLAGSPALSITPAPLTASIADPSKVYGSPDPAPATIAATPGGLVNTSVTDWNGAVTAMNDAGRVAVSLAGYARVPGENAGSYAITGTTFSAPGGPAGGNYAVPVLSGTPTLAITPAPLTIRADDKSRVAGAPDPPFTATYTGFVNGETPAVLSGVLLFATPAVPASPPGQYVIAAAGQAAINYSIGYVPGLLTVTPLPQPAIAPAALADVPFERPLMQAVTYGFLDPGAAPMIASGPALVEEGGAVFGGSPPAQAVAGAGGPGAPGPFVGAAGEVRRGPAARALECLASRTVGALWCRGR
ncbi:MAG: filamentous hemagglutinin N-terminal domain-containing protein [Burkholderiales bacterium]|nr:filamentous hemagglutinin N-terminal domain-containing protein [Burkholderiales bacterium]